MLSVRPKTISGEPRAEPLFDNMAGFFRFNTQYTTHVVVTGAAGFIGSHATLSLIREGYAVTGFDNLSRGNGGALKKLKELAETGQLRLLRGDLGSPTDLDKLFSNSNLSVFAVLHFAAVAYVAESVIDPLKYYQNITINTVHILNSMRKHAVKRLIYSSTCATYGNVASLPITELTPTNPVNPYGRAKLYAESIIQDYARADTSFDAVILRYFNVFGADPSTLLGEFPALQNFSRISGACFDAALGHKDALTITGTNFETKDGSCVRDYIHVSDLVDAHLSVLKRASNPPRLYNVGTGSGQSVKEFVRACKTVTGIDFIVKEQEKARPGDYAEVYANVDKIQKEIGWTAKYSDLEQGLQHGWKWRRENPDGYAYQAD